MVASLQIYKLTGPGLGHAVSCGSFLRSIEKHIVITTCYAEVSQKSKLCTGWARGLVLWMRNALGASKPSPRRGSIQSHSESGCCSKEKKKSESGRVSWPEETQSRGLEGDSARPSPGSDAAAAVGHGPLPPSHGHRWPSAFSPLFAISAPHVPRRTSRQGRRRQGLLLLLLLSITGLFLRFADGGFRQEDGGRQPRCHLLQVMVLVRLIAPTEPNLAFIHC